MVILGGCAAYTTYQLDQQFGAPTVQDRTLTDSTATAGQIDYHGDVKDLLDRRCVVCHACYDAPCQLKLTAPEGIDRGANATKVYDGGRLRAAFPTRLFIDGQTTADWRDKGFYPVLNEREQTPAANARGGVLYRLLNLKQAAPPPSSPILPDSYDFALDRKQQCPQIDDMDAYERKYPLWGMPYGLPALSTQEFATLEAWLAQGARSSPAPGPTPEEVQQIVTWETFFNNETSKGRLANRYIYEHLFLAHLHFPQAGSQHFFRLVRSMTPPGEPLREIATRRPYDDPGPEPFYYRLRKVEETITEKNHMPYALDTTRMKRWNTLFLDRDYRVTTLPGYGDSAANPFVIFREIPADSRYRFMLDEAEFTIMGFIKGPVCRGQVSLNVITDHFWVVFANPDSPTARAGNEQLADMADFLRLPAEEGSTLRPLSAWLKYSKLQKGYLEAKATYLGKRLNETNPITLDLVWDGDGNNQNAALTVFRHYDSAAVLKGLRGGRPQTAWLIGYPLLERIHYLLVADFDVYGNVGHQLLSRLYMDFLRMEGEMNFLAFLPDDVAQATLSNWYRDATSHVADYANALQTISADASGIAYRTDDPFMEFFSLLEARLGPKVIAPDPVYQSASPSTRQASAQTAIQDLAAVRGSALEWFPELALLRSDGKVYSLVNNIAHTNVASLFGEKKRLIPKEQTLSVIPGFAGSYPNVMLEVPAGKLPALTAAMASLASEADFRHLLDDFGVRRTNPQFWAYSDWLLDYYASTQPVESGLLDYNRLDNR
ncbi:MAG: fatty acid cis/trans isomerase [Gammaproteobacteria bacterium]